MKYYLFKKVNFFIILGLFSLLVNWFPEILQIISPNLPFDYLAQCFVDDSENIIIVNTRYNCIQKYNKDGDFLLSWNTSFCRLSGVNARFENGILHIFCGRYGKYYQYTESGELLQSIKLEYKELNEILNKFIKKQDSRIEKKGILPFYSYLVFHRDDGEIINIKSNLLWIFSFPFPGLLYLIIGSIISFLRDKELHKRILNKIKKRDFYKW